MKNVTIADNQTERIRDILIKVSKTEHKSVTIPVDDLLDTLACLERLSLLERHLANLVSDAYTEENNE